MFRVFVSYRRDDSAGFAGRLSDALERRFGAGSVFRDVDDITPGADFGAVIEHGLGQVQAVLVVIGPHWIGAADARGRRLDRSDDLVRREVELALASGKPVLPVLVGGAPMPDADMLPPSMRALAGRNALALGDASWTADLARLEAALLQWLPPFGPSVRTARRQVALLAAAAFALGAGGWWWWLRGSTPDAGALAGEWRAEVVYPWNLTVREHYLFTVDGGRIGGSASFLGVARALEAVEWGDGRARFQTRSEIISGDGPARQLVQKYEVWRDGEALHVRLQIHRDHAVDPPFEFVAHRPASAPVRAGAP